MGPVPPTRISVPGRAYYAASVEQFLADSDDTVLAALTNASTFSIELTQRNAWTEQMAVLRRTFGEAGEWWSADEPGLVAFEFSVPRMGRRIDVLLLLRGTIFVLEFKVGESQFRADAMYQVWDYALDMKNFHAGSHGLPVVPVLVATDAPSGSASQPIRRDTDGVVRPLRASPAELAELIGRVLESGTPGRVDAAAWLAAGYKPTPTIIEAATTLYARHNVENITHREAEAEAFTTTSETIQRIIRDARAHGRKAICFVTGVPGAGKTLVGLDVATRNFDKKSELYSVFLSGNGPLVAVLCEALAKDRAATLRGQGKPAALGEIRSEVKAFIQNVHHFRDDCIAAGDRPPVEHVALFDEAQRAWTLEQTARFMRQKKGHPNFAMSEPAFLISCLDRHRDWAVVVCLVGGGQEINTGEAGIAEWLHAVRTQFPEWHVHISPHLRDSEYAAGTAIEMLGDHRHVSTDDSLHLSVSMRSFRAEHVSAWVKAVLDADRAAARTHWSSIAERYPVVLSRDLRRAKAWLRERARGTERYGLVVSSEALRLKPEAIDVRADIDPVHWFLKSPEDVRSSYYLEDAATEFHVQGLELDWTCVVWDADLRFSPEGWNHWSFSGSKWKRMLVPEHQTHLKNAYRVLLTRARQGMVIVVPPGDAEDPTRDPAVYDATFDYLSELGVPVVG
jgi:hypothetical protein